MCRLNSNFRFLLGYHIFETKEIVLDFKRISIRYLKTYFVFDLVSASPIGITIMNLFDHDDRFVMYTLTTARLVRYSRLRTMLEYFKQISTMWKIKNITHDIICLVMLAVFVVHFCACIAYAVPKIRFKVDGIHFPSNSWIVKADILPVKGSSRNIQYLYSVLMVSCHLYLAGTGSFIVEDTLEQIVFTFILIAGLINFAYIAAVIFQILSLTNVSELKYDDIMAQLHSYSIHKKLPSTLRHRLILYFENKFQKHLFREHSILLTLSEHFRNELNVFCTERLLKKIPIFDQLSVSAITDLTTYLKQDVFLPNDVLYVAGSKAEAMYFIVYGTVAFMLPNGKELCHFNSGDHFGEGTLVLNVGNLERPCTCVAVEFTECLRLESQDLWQLMRTNGDFENRITLIARDHYEKLIGLIRRTQNDELVAGRKRGGLLYDMRHGKLLSQQRPRHSLIKK